MTKNEHAIWAACFLPSIYVRRCVSLPSFVASQRRQVYLCGCRAPADPCAIRLIYYLPSAKCGHVFLSVGCHVYLGVGPFIPVQYQHAISNTPFHGLIWLRTQLLCSCTLFSPAPFVVCHVCSFSIPASFLPDMPMLLLLLAAPVNLWYPLFRCILP